MESGRQYPTFLLYYVRNPGPLLLFDVDVNGASFKDERLSIISDGNWAFCERLEG